MILKIFCIPIFYTLSLTHSDIKRNKVVRRIFFLTYVCPSASFETMFSKMLNVLIKQTTISNYIGKMSEVE